MNKLACSVRCLLVILVMELINRNTIEKLLDLDISEEDEKMLSSKLIEDNDLPLSLEVIVTAFSDIRYWLSRNGNNIISLSYRSHSYKRNLAKFLGNVNLFVAFVLSLNEELDFDEGYLLIDSEMGAETGSLKVNQLYYKLLDYHYFDPSLVHGLHPEFVSEMQEYANKKYGSGLTKRANK